MKWILKAIVQKVISLLPQSQKINFWFQKNITKGVLLSDQHFSDKLTAAIDHLKYYHKYSSRENYLALELGSGWYPVVPIALFLNGAKSIHSIDISPLMKVEGIRESIEKYLLWHQNGQLLELEPFIKQERLDALRSFLKEEGTREDLLRKLNLKLHITDARNTSFDDNHFDLVCSNNTYEHIYPAVLKGIIGEFQRVLKPGGINSHFIDMSDHFAHLDQSITIYNFLRFSQSQWRKIDNSVQPQNRMRKKDYEQLYAEAGVEIIESKDRPGSIENLQKVRLHPDFADKYCLEDLAISHSHLVSTK